jgi:hypothetical protein
MLNAINKKLRINFCVRARHFAFELLADVKVVQWTGGLQISATLFVQNHRIV